MYLQDRANYYFTNYFLLKVGIIYNFLFVYKNAVLAVSNGCQTNILCVKYFPGNATQNIANVFCNDHRVVNTKNDLYRRFTDLMRINNV